MNAAVGGTKNEKNLFRIAGEVIRRGERKRLQLHVAALYDYTPLNIPIEVIRGKEEGPTMFISAAIHGDELIGNEIIKRLLKRSFLKRIHGTLILVPVVNIFGFNNLSRYLPDRRDLNRCFPGSKTGSLGSRLAAIFMKEIVNKCSHGIDLHTAAIHRTNLPQIRACLDDPETRELAESFGVPFLIHSRLRDGSLREAARKRKVTTLLFEGGEALRFDENVIRSGLKGCLSVMRKIGMIPEPEHRSIVRAPKKIYVAEASYWLRATHSGSFRITKKVGDQVSEGETLAVITDPFGSDPHEIKAEEGGIIIGMSTLPLVNQGDAMVHVATFKNSSRVKRAMDLYDETIV